MLNEMNSDGYATTVPQGLGRVLVVEDDGLLAIMVEDLLRETGAAEVVVSHDPAHALRVAEEQPLDCAILDISVWGSSTTGVADILAKRDIPFLFCTGFTANDLEERHRGRPLLTKPYSDLEFRVALAAALKR